ncbi:MAG TPA: amino acid ABC transporter substrate-binding protein [Firmicutes bacterium]|nr:amino acid ABC transporter substrate-binding protein [Bacillota bacterium]
MRRYSHVIGNLVVIALLMTCILGSSSLAADQDLLNKIMTRGKLVVGVSLTSPIVAFKEPDGTPAGFTVDLAKLIAKELGVKIEFQDYEWQGLIPALLTGKVDIITAQMSATLERATKVTFTQPWLYTGTCAVVRRDSPYKHWRDLNKSGIAIGANAGSVGAAVVKEFLPKATLVTFPTDADFLAALKAKRVEAVMTDQLIGVAYGKEPGLRLINKIIKPDFYAFTLRPEDVHMWQWLNLFFDVIKADGRYAAIYKKWMGEDWKPEPRPW